MRTLQDASIGVCVRTARAGRIVPIMRMCGLIQRAIECDALTTARLAIIIHHEH